MAVLTDIDFGQKVCKCRAPSPTSGFSTTGQTTENQIQEIETAGFKVDPRRIVSETVSGSSAIEQRLGFIKLLNKLEQDDVLIVTN